MTNSDAIFSDDMAAFYDRWAVPLFGPYAEDIAARARMPELAEVLEVAAGTGIVTEALARALPQSVAIVATDLSDAMVEFAAARRGDWRVGWRQADALALPFDPGCFDLVVCQFGTMFYPDRVAGHREARRVLKEGGRYLFNVWDSAEQNPDVAVVEDAVAALLPVPRPGFLRRVPFAYHDPDAIRRDLWQAGFADCTIDRVTTTWHAASADEVALSYCHGTPLRAEIELAAPGGLDLAMQAVAAAIAARFGSVRPAMPRRALVVEAVK
ncbi:MAG: class I SAM-dependent methyltransferase [Proteobacteria bacterium]|nr:class I SAM-dependent methyltransferase [Pseudomonadota bacterium]